MKSINEKINESKISRDKLIDSIYNYMEDYIKNISSKEFLDIIVSELKDEQLDRLISKLDDYIIEH